jgi:hypothetical protein
LREKAPEPGIRRGRALSMPTRERSAIAATGRRDLEGGGGAEKEACKRLSRVRRRRGESGLPFVYYTTYRKLHSVKIQKYNHVILSQNNNYVIITER